MTTVVRNALEGKFHRVGPDCHIGLLLDRCLPFPVGPAGPDFGSEEKSRILAQAAERANNAWRASDALWRTWSRRHAELPGAPCVSFVVEPRWRWIVGLGRESVLETGITLHHTFGVPYLPGSALKGMTSALAALDYLPEQMDQATFTAMFGEHKPDPEQDRPDAAGNVVFLDVVPIDLPRLEVDVMTPHFPKYYGGERRHPLEIEDPTPIPFLTVAGGRFRATLLGRDKATDVALVEQAAELAREALEDLGAGGKTAKGYGYFRSVEGG